jgi:hypothetical protein
MAKDIAAIPDSHQSVIESGLRLLMDICAEWVKLLQVTRETFDIVVPPSSCL